MAKEDQLCLWSEVLPEEMPRAPRPPQPQEDKSGQVEAANPHCRWAATDSRSLPPTPDSDPLIPDPGNFDQF